MGKEVVEKILFDGRVEEFRRKINNNSYISKYDYNLTLDFEGENNIYLLNLLNKIIDGKYNSTRDFCHYINNVSNITLNEEMYEKVANYITSRCNAYTKEEIKTINQLFGIEDVETFCLTFSHQIAMDIVKKRIDKDIVLEKLLNLMSEDCDTEKYYNIFSVYYPFVKQEIFDQETALKYDAEYKKSLNNSGNHTLVESNKLYPIFINDTWYYMNNQGKIVIECDKNVIHASDFVNDVAIVTVFDEEQNQELRVHIDKKGKIIKPYFEMQLDDKNNIQRKRV